MLNRASPDTTELAPICSRCQLRGLCLPDSLGAPTAESIGSIIKARPAVPRGSYLFHQGAPMTGYYFLRSGSAKAIVDHGDGRESVIGFLLPTDIIGAGAMQQSTYYDSVVTLERSAYCVVTVADLDALFQKRPSIQRTFESKVTQRIHLERHARVRLDHTDSEQRVADFILELSDRLHKLGRDPDDLRLPMSRHDIGSYLDLAAETVSRTLRRLDGSGFIKVRVKRLQITNRDGLERLAATTA